MDAARLARARAEMVAEQLRDRGILDERVLDAMGRVPRERFVDPDLEDRAYDDGPLPIGEGQTISQPYMVARMVELLALRGDERVLEVGAGSGYQTAVLAELAAQVFAVERLPSLGATATARLSALDYSNVEIGIFDGTEGWAARAPFDAIVVAAGAPEVPDVLVAQLAEGGRLVIPVGPRELQRLAIIEWRDGATATSWETSCVFVPLIGRHGWGEGRA